jgi:hypothetical protein
MANQSFGDESSHFVCKMSDILVHKVFDLFTFQQTQSNLFIFTNGMKSAHT